MKMMLDVAIVTDTRLLNPVTATDSVQSFHALQEEQRLILALRTKGITVKKLAWDDPAFDWTQTRLAVIRSTWNYYDKLEEFKLWLDRTKTQTRIMNTPEIIQWNLNKRYLNDLADKGINTIKTLFLAPDTAETLTDLFSHLETGDIVIKPAVSAGGKDTYRISRRTQADFEPRFKELLSTKALMVQPFQNTILKQGEVSLTFIDGQHTHAIQKTVKKGEFRVQDSLGGKVIPYTPTTAEIIFANKAIARCPAAPLYARVDIINDNDNELALMELELIEPELFFRFAPESADRLANAIIKYK